MTKLISDKKMDEIRQDLTKYLNEKYAEYSDRISISLDQRLDLIEVSPGMYTLSDEAAQRLRPKKEISK